MSFLRRKKSRNELFTTLGSLVGMLAASALTNWFFRRRRERRDALARYRGLGATHPAPPPPPWTPPSGARRESGRPDESMP
jgi:hypothetical protein